MHLRNLDVSTYSGCLFLLLQNKAKSKSNGLKNVLFLYFPTVCYDIVYTNFSVSVPPVWVILYPTTKLK